jgi:hypothetical protein
MVSGSTTIGVSNAVSRTVGEWGQAHRYTVLIYSSLKRWAYPMDREFAVIVNPESSAMVEWQVMLRDEVALLAMPGAHHKALLKEAHALYRGNLINARVLSDLLELADAALAYAVEALLDLRTDE